MKRLKLYLFGSPHIESGGKLIDLRLRKAMALLAYLTVTRKVFTRDTLATLFWPKSDQQTSRADLRRTLYNLKRIVGEGHLEASPDTIGIRSDANLWADTETFESTAARFTAPTEADNNRSAGLIEAVELYSGDFMAGFNLPDCPEFDEWQFFKREFFQQTGVRVLEALISLSERDGRFDEAISFARRRLSFDRLHEPTHRYLMRIYDQIGHKSAALRQYRECRRILKTELGASPQPHTIELYEAVKTRRSTAATSNEPIMPNTRYAKSGNTFIAYQVIGQGSVDILMVPGFVSHIEHCWQEPGLVAFFYRLSKFARIILFDRRGIGLSDRVGDPPTIERTIDDIHAVLAAAGSKRPFLFGASEGGPAILKYAARYPGNCRGLILYGTMAKGTRSDGYPFALSKDQYDAWLEQLVSEWGSPNGMEYFAPSRRRDPKLARWWASMLRLSSSPGNVRLILEALRDIDVRSLLPEIKLPTLILHRKQDAAIRVEAARYIAEQMPNSELVELEGQDHWWWIGEVDPIMRQLERFTLRVSQKVLLPLPLRERTEGRGL